MAAANQGAYPDVDSRPSFPDLERTVIERWEAERTFERSVAQRDGAEEFVFYDGPPFANGQPHYGHLLTGFVKDAVPRYQTMRGRKVERRFGWDCHGLPAEQEAEKRLGVMGRKAIEELGVDVFNAECRALVTGTADSWHSYVTRQARWVDMENDYKTMDTTFMESVMWAFKTLHDKGLAYEGLRVLPYCWECETPLSNFETRMDDAYRDRQDPAITVWVELTSGDHAGRRLLVWTTTPWTLPSNLAVAVGTELSYEVYRDTSPDGGGHEYVLGTDTVGTYDAQLADAEHVATLTGTELGGADYAPIFDFFAGTENAHRVLVADWVADDEGTGIVHIAPGFGEDDKAICDEAGIPTIVPVDEKGAFTAEVRPYAGMQVFDANREITRDLKERGVLVRHDSYVHSYPHCWRTDTPLIYKALSSWFVAVTEIKDRMLDLNQQINWVPEHVRDGSFGRWLEGARDWSISRNRFWGSPIPVWKSDDPAYPRVDVYGSIADLEADFGVTVTDLHRPMIDELVRPNPDDPTGRSTMCRIPDVLDCWFESGSMPFAQVHYPFENQRWFEDHFPGDFICEYIGQTRGWFYTLHVLSTALFDRPAFANCVVHGVLLGDDGQKLSKRLRNYPDPVEVFDTIGSDAMRWSLLSSNAVRGGDMVAAKEPMQDAVRQVLLPIWNAWYFLALYANAGDEVRRGRRVHADATLDHVLDRYVLAKTRTLVEEATVRMDEFDLSGAATAISTFLDSLNNWYIRRSRERFWGEDQTAVDVLHTVLDDLLRVAAPLLPLLTEQVWRDLTGRGSVHLADWPDPGALPADPDLVEAMDRVRGIASAAKSIREARGLRRRLPLRTLTIATADNESLAPFESLIADEVNVKAVSFVPRGSLGEERFEVDLRAVGKRLGPDTPVVVQAIKAGDYTYDSDADQLVVHGESDATLRFGPDEYVRKLEADDPASTAATPGGDGLVRLDCEVTADLEAEGLVRDLAREVNELRRHDGFDVSDRIRLVLDAGHHDDLRAAVEDHRDYLTDATLTVELVLTDDALRGAHRVELADGRAVHVAVAPHRADG